MKLAQRLYDSIREYSKSERTNPYVYMTDNSFDELCSQVSSQYRCSLLMNQMYYGAHIVVVSDHELEGEDYKI